MTYKITIPGRLPGLNEYTAACRTHAQAGAKMKRDAEMAVKYQLASAMVRGELPDHFREPVELEYSFFEPSRRRDQDNVSSFARKVIQDAMVSQGLLSNDGWGSIRRSIEMFDVSRKDPRIEVWVREASENGSHGCI